MNPEKKRIVYAEPPEYIPEDLRRKYKLGEFAEPKEEKKKPAPVKKKMINGEDFPHQ